MKSVNPAAFFILFFSIEFKMLGNYYYYAFRPWTSERNYVVIQRVPGEVIGPLQLVSQMVQKHLAVCWARNALGQDKKIKLPF